MFSFFLVVAFLIFLVWAFLKGLGPWANEHPDPLQDAYDEIKAEARGAFGKREVPPAASKNDPGVAGGPKL